MKTILVVALLAFASLAGAGGFQGTNVGENLAYVNYTGCSGAIVLVQGGTIAQTYDGVYIQGAAFDPLLSFPIGNNFSATIQPKSNIGEEWSWFDILYNGSGTCFVRLMNLNNKSSYPAIPVLP